MNIPSSRTAGASSMAASSRSFSRKALGRARDVRGWGNATEPAAFPAPPAIGFFTLGSPVDALELAGRPLDRVLGLHALDGLSVHVHDDVLRVDLGGLGRGRPGVAEHARGSGRLPVDLHGRVDRAPQRMLLPELRGTYRESLGHLEPLAELVLAVEPLEEVLGQLLVLAVLH